MTHVLVPVDGSEPADDALAFVRDRLPEASVTALYVIDPLVDYSRRSSFPGYTGPGEFRNERQKAEATLEGVADRYGESFDSLETEVVAGDPARAIVRFAENGGVDRIVIGSHGRDRAARVLLGSTAESVVRRAPVPVTVVR